MKMPDIVHPRLFKIKGIIFQVMSYGPLNEEQAEKLARAYYRSRKWSATDRGRQFDVKTHAEQDAAGIL